MMSSGVGMLIIGWSGWLSAAVSGTNYTGIVRH